MHYFTVKKDINRLKAAVHCPGAVDGALFNNEDLLFCRSPFRA